MPGCILRYCTNHSRNTSKGQGITFHLFPRPDNENRELWINFVQKDRSEEKWLPTNYSYICSKHFKEDDKYTTKTGRAYLKKSAIPCKNLTKSEEPEILQPFSEASISSSESIFDSSSKITLKMQMRKEYMAKTKLIDTIKKIRRQNIYLKKKCNSYKKIIENLKNKLSDDKNK